MYDVLKKRYSRNFVFSSSEGIEVFYEVDATALHTNQNINQRKFDNLVFNFPHIGGKSKIDLNRTLLKEFFSRCCFIL